MLVSCSEEDDIQFFEDPRDKFTGQWSVNNESCQKSRYTVTISNDPSNSIQVLMYNFGFSNVSRPDTAIVAGNTITLPRQLNQEKWIIEGTGIYEDNKIQWEYSLEISGSLEACTATYIQ